MNEQESSNELGLWLEASRLLIRRGRSSRKVSSNSESRVFRSVDDENEGADDDQKDDEYKNPASSVG